MSKSKSSSDFFSLGDESDSDGRGSGSEDETRKDKSSAKSRAVKRRRVDFGVQSDSEGDQSETEGEEAGQEKAIVNFEESEGESVQGKPVKKVKEDKHEVEEEDEEGSVFGEEDEKDITEPSKLTPLTPAQLEESKRRLKKTGVIYLSSIPPFMKPEKVRHLLSPFGTINRIFLVPEDPKATKARVKSGGNKRKKFVEGWVEFADKKNARRCVETLNAQIVGGKKGNYYHDDVWNMKYLKGFKWGDLQAQISYENASRQSKLRAEIAQATRENKTFLKNVERAKMVEGIQAKRKKKRKAEDDAAGEEKVPKQQIRRTFRQNELKGNAAESADKAKSKAPKKERSEAVNRVLKNIF